jgi:hypothetical protein
MLAYYLESCEVKIRLTWNIILKLKNKLKVMDAKDKAMELFNSFEADLMEADVYYLDYAKKRCALIAVQQIINSNPHSNPLNTNVYSTMDYWLEVKHEIKKL